MKLIHIFQKVSGSDNCLLKSMNEHESGCETASADLADSSIRACPTWTR